jgi:ATP-dependent Clp protease ATP-binding subunit ClpB
LPVRHRPEFINRVDDIIVFNPLKKSEILKIVEIELLPLFNRLAERGISLSVSDKVKGFLTEQGFDLHFGARPLKRTVQRYIQDPLSLKILEGSLKQGDKIRAELDGPKKVIFKEL